MNRSRYREWVQGNIAVFDFELARLLVRSTGFQTNDGVLRL